MLRKMLVLIAAGTFLISATAVWAEREGALKERGQASRQLSSDPAVQQRPLQRQGRPVPKISIKITVETEGPDGKEVEKKIEIEAVENLDVAMNALHRIMNEYGPKQLNAQAAAIRDKAVTVKKEFVAKAAETKVAAQKAVVQRGANRIAELTKQVEALQAKVDRLGLQVRKNAQAIKKEVAPGGMGQGMGMGGISGTGRGMGRGMGMGGASGQGRGMGGVAPGQGRGMRGMARIAEPELQIGIYQDLSKANYCPQCNCPHCQAVRAALEAESKKVEPVRQMRRSRARVANRKADTDEDDEDDHDDD